MDLLSKKLGGCLGKVSYGKSVVYDSRSLENLVEADGVILVERVDVSGYADIEHPVGLHTAKHCKNSCTNQHQKNQLTPLLQYTIN